MSVSFRIQLWVRDGLHKGLARVGTGGSGWAQGLGHRGPHAWTPVSIRWLGGKSGRNVWSGQELRHWVTK
jgi:hypothetical protein